MRVGHRTRSLAIATAIGIGFSLSVSPAWAQSSRDAATVELTVAELKSLARTVREARATSAQPPVIYILPPPPAPYAMAHDRQMASAPGSDARPGAGPSRSATEAELAGVNDRLARLERTLAEAEADRDPRARARPTTTTTAPPAGREGDPNRSSDTDELTRLRRELAATRAELTAERQRPRGNESPAEAQARARVEREAADRERERLADQLEARERDHRRELDRLRDDLRRLERERDADRRLAGRRDTDVRVAVPTPVLPVPTAATPTTDTVALLRAERQRAELERLRDELQRREGELAAAAARRPDTVVVEREIEVRAPVERVRDTLRIERTIERAATPSVLNLSAVLFASGSATVGADDAVAMAAAADAYRATPGEVLLRGWSSPEGNPAANQRLSQRRALAVRDALVLRGIPPSAIRVLEGGIDTTSGSAALARRVEIQLRRG